MRIRIRVSVWAQWNYRRHWLLSACTYNLWQQGNMRLTKAMRLIKRAKTNITNVPRRPQGCEVQNNGQKVNRKHISQGLSSPADY